MQENCSVAEVSDFNSDIESAKRPTAVEGSVQSKCFPRRCSYGSVPAGKGTLCDGDMNASSRRHRSERGEIKGSYQVCWKPFASPIVTHSLSKWVVESIHDGTTQSLVHLGLLPHCVYSSARTLAYPTKERTKGFS